jgi:tetratricopeptide (TPR) repeat protein
MKTISMLGLGLVALLVGCGDNQNRSSIQNVGDAAAMNSGGQQFDQAKEPALTADTHFAAGQLAESQGQPVRAIEQYTEALKVDPKHQPSMYRIAVIQTQAKQYDQAIASWKQYVQATDNSAAGYSNLGFCYELAQRPSDAEAAYKSGIAKDPQNQPCRINYGLMLARNGRQAEAVTHLSAVLKPGEVHYNLASLYEQLGRKDEARKEYETALRLDPGMWEAESRLSKLD